MIGLIPLYASLTVCAGVLVGLVAHWIFEMFAHARELREREQERA